MKNKTILLLLLLLMHTNYTRAQYPYGDNWYTNPLGFKPLELHASMGFLLPAAVVGVGLLLSPKDTSLHQRLSVYNEAGFTWGYKYPYTFMAQNNTGINYQLRKWMSVGVEASVCMPADGYNSTAGIAVRPFARFYPIYRERFRLYFESGGGMVYFFDDFPRPTLQDARNGTRYNGITKYGLGAEVNFSPATSVLFGIRHLHVSNGNRRGVERNPSHDSNGWFIGVSHMW